MKRKQSGIKIMARLIGLVKPLAGFMVLAVFLGVTGFLCAISITVVGALGLLDAAGFSGGIAVGAAFAIVAVCAVLRGLLHYGEQACNHYIAFKLLALIRDKIFRAMRRLAPAKLEGRDKGNLISIITSDIELLEVFYAHTISPICIAVITCAVMLVFFAHYHVLFMLIALLAYVVVGVVVPLTASHFSRDAGMTYRSRAGALSSYLLDSMRGLVETIRFGKTKERLQEMEKRTDELNALQSSMKKTEGHTGAAADSVILAFSFAMLFSGIVLYNQGAVGFDAVLASTVGMMSSFGPVAALSGLAGNLTHTLASGERVLDILDETPAVCENTDGAEVQFGGMACSGVDFAYNEEQILRGFDMQVPEKGVLGIQGPSGSGKSTVLRLLMRFWDVQGGRVSMSCKNVKEIKTASLRSNQSFVTQETQLFHTSIEENIKIAKAHATHAEVVEAAKKASVHDFIMTLPDGYDTNVGELGDLLSGGERQRIGLARAFLSDAPMILLDEPTSNLDSLNEGRILKSLDRVKKDKSILLVSHRASTMRIAEKVYSVDNGRLS